MSPAGVRPRYSVVVPTYNATTSPAQLAERVGAVFREREAAYEVVLVDDASPNPETWPALEALAAADPNVRVLRLTRNFGQQAATICGMRHARGDWVLTMDDDLQHRPEDIPALLAAEDHDIVIAQFPRKRHGPVKRLVSWLKGWFDHALIGKPRGLQLTAFRLVRRTIAEGATAIETPYPFLPAMLFHVSKDVVGVECGHDDRAEGDSQYTVRKMVAMFSNLLINNSSALLAWMGMAGAAVAGLSFVAGIYFIYQKLIVGVAVPGWTSVIVSVLFLGGLTLISMGIIGQYLIRIIAGVERKPMVHVREARGFDDDGG